MSPQDRSGFGVPPWGAYQTSRNFETPVAKGPILSTRWSEVQPLDLYEDALTCGHPSAASMTASSWPRRLFVDVGRSPPEVPA